MSKENARYFIAPLVALAILVHAAKVFAAGEVYLSTRRTESKLVELAVPPFLIPGRDEEKLGEQAARIINYDLKFTNYFAPNHNIEFLRQAQQRDIRTGRINYNEWRTLASNFLVKGNIAPRQDGKMSVETRVYDLQARKLFFAKRYTGSRKLFRQMIHQFSDDMLMRLTGESGVARTRMAFVSRVDGYKELMIMDYDGHDPRPVTSDRSIVLFPDWNHKRPDLILFTTYRYRNPDLYAVDLRARTRYPISRRVGLNSTGEWSPDGAQVVFSLSRHGNSDIYIANADGSSPRRLTSALSIETSPTWSPDGQWIAYTSDRSGSPQIYAMRSDGSEKRRLTYKGGYNDGANWAPKGPLVAYTTLLGSRFDIALVSFVDRSITRLTFGRGSNETPSWAPNGRHIAFSSSRHGKKQVYAMGVSGQNITRVSNLAGGGYLPSWGPD